MSFELMPYIKLKQNVKQSIQSLIEHHHPDRKGTIDLAKLGESVKLLSANPEGRGIQSEFLLEVMKLTDAMADEGRKTLLLNAAVYHIHMLITASYSVRSADSSSFNFSLKTSLGLNTTEEKMQPNDDDEYIMYKSLVEFLEGQVFRAEHQHLVYVDKHPFSAIKGYDAGGDINGLTDKVHELAKKRFATAKAEHAAAVRPASSAAGLLSWIGLGGAAKKPAEEATVAAKKPAEEAVAPTP